MERNATDTSWVKTFIHNVFAGDSKDADKYMEEKMTYINRPFYKYCYVCEEAKRTADTIDYNILNFENDELFFQDPSLFNDPFDCYLGFSQIQLIKNLLVATMREQKKYTPDMRKAINLFFTENSTEQMPVEQLDSQIAREVMDAIILIALSSSELDPQVNEYIQEIAKILTSEENVHLFIKMLQNRLTVADKHKIIDLMYSNGAFRKYIVSSLENTEHSDWILEMMQRDQKLKVETTPDSFLFEGGTDTFQQFDFFQLLLNAALGKTESPELAEIKQQFSVLSDTAMAKSRKLISEQCRVTCLSEKMDSPLMWSHYANKHYGFCLEYDFTHSMVNRYPDLNLAKIMLLPVIYSEKRPLLSNAILNSKNALQYLKTKKLPNEVIENIVYGLLFKSLDWSYEHEWRIIGLNMIKPVMKLPPARKLFLGANIEESIKTRLIEVAKKKHIPVYQMFLSSDRYKFEYYRIE